MRWLCVLALCLVVSRADELDTIRAESNPEKRADKMLDFARKTLSGARDAYNAGDYKKSLASVQQIGALVDEARASLKQSGKSPRRSKYFKRAEQKTHELFRHLDEFAREAALDDRAPIDKVARHVSEVHDELLTGILERK